MFGIKDSTQGNRIAKLRFFLLFPALVVSLCILASDQVNAAGGIKLLEKIVEKISRHPDDAVKAMKSMGKSAKVLGNAEKASLIKKFPSLANKSEDILHASASVISFCEKNGQEAMRLAGALKSPAVLVRWNAKNPKTWELVSTGAKNLEKLPKLPAEVASSIEKAGNNKEVLGKISGMLGNYENSANAFAEMLRTGGKKAAEVAGKLLTIAKNNPKTSIAVGFLAWHMADPAGCEKSVDDFLENHIEPIVKKVPEAIIDHGVKPFVDVTTAEAEKVVNNVVGNIFKSPTTIFIVLALLVFFIPPARRSAKLLICWPFEKLNGKLEKSMGKSVDPGNTSDADRIERAKFQASLRGGKR